MNSLESNDCIRPGPGGVKGWFGNLPIVLSPYVFAALRRVWPIAGTDKLRIVTRYDDVIEVFAADAAFGVPYHANLDVITGGEAFFLGLSDTPEYRAQLDAIRAMVRPGDLVRLGDDAEARSAAIVSAANGRVEVVDLIRQVSFDMIGAYFGVGRPARGRLDVWGSRLFEFQFTGSPDDKPWLAEVEQFANALRAHIDAGIAARKAVPTDDDDILARCLAEQAAGHPGYSDAEIRTVLLCMIVGGPPQPPMVVPQGVEQLLRRPEWLAAACGAARSGDDARLHAILQEAMRFDPLAPGLQRIALADYTLARGTPRATTIRKGAKVINSFASAMRDPRRLPDPDRFDPDRQPHEYVHYGHGLHACFGRHINHVTLHRMLKPLLAKPGLRRAAGAEGHLRKNGAFADRLVVVFD